MLHVFFSVLLIGAGSARAQLDDESQKVLIQKLNSIYLTLPAEDPSKVAVTLRLADLYAERARKNSMSGCTGCVDPAADRQKALRLYGEVLARTPEASRSKVLIQIGHLHQLNGRDDLAGEFYCKVIQAEKDPAVLAEAHLSVGEIAFKKRDYGKAVRHYEEVLRQPRAGSRGLAAYRRAWSHFHMGQTARAEDELKEMLRTPELLARGSAQTGTADSQFHEEVSRDLATFMAGGRVSAEEIETLFRLSPQSTQVANVQFLAAETDRLGKRDDALLALNFVSGKLANPMDRVAALLMIAQIRLDKAEKAEALKSYESGIQLWRELSYKDSAPEQELRRRARSFVVGWNQSEKKAPSAELLAAYELYLSLFPADADARMYAAQVARELKNWNASWSHLAAAGELAASDAEKLESILLAQLEIGELAKDPVLASKAYDSYIQRSPRKTKLLEVRYQKAHAIYERGDHAAAAEELRAVALTEGEKSGLKKQAADLSLDALVLAKDEDRLLLWAKEYEKAFPQARAEFVQVQNKALLTRAARLADTDVTAALAALNGMDPAQASAADRIKYYRNRLILAERAGQMAVAAAAADALLAQPGLSAEDRELAWSRKAYFAELRLDFSTAFTATERLEKTYTPDEKNFKLAVFAELAGKPSSPFYLKYLSQSRDEERKPLVAAELVRKSRTPEAQLAGVGPALAANPELHAQLHAEVYAKTRNEKTLQKVTQDKTLKATAAGRLLSRVAHLGEFSRLRAALEADKFDSSGNAKLAKSIKRRASLLDKAELLAQRALESGDWTSQLVSIDLLARESERFYNEIMTSPAPSGLTPEEEQQYLGLLSAQAAPFQAKAAEAKAKVSQFWQADWQKPLAASWEQEPLRPLISIEVEALKSVAPVEQRAKFDALATVPAGTKRPSLGELAAARRKVYENPMDKTALEELLGLERKAENSAMSDYLATRLERLKDKGTL